MEKFDTDTPHDDANYIVSNTATTKSGTSDAYVSSEQNLKGDMIDEELDVRESREEIQKTLKQINHDQYNKIQKLKKDLQYWQNKWINLTIDNQVAEFDLKNIAQNKNSANSENKELKEKIESLEKSITDHEVAYEELKTKYETALNDLEKLKKQNEEEKKNKVEYGSLEEEIVAKAMTLPDLNTTWRVIYALQAGAQQRMYASTGASFAYPAMAQSNAGSNTSAQQTTVASNTVANGHVKTQNVQQNINPMMHMGVNPLLQNTNFTYNGAHKASEPKTNDKN